MPFVIPEPLRVCPNAIAPLAIAVTVSMFHDIEPVNTAPIVPPGPIVYCVTPGDIG